MIDFLIAAAMAAVIIWIVAVFNSVIRRKNMVETLSLQSMPCSKGATT